MSTETTPDLFRRAANAWVGDTASDDYARHKLRRRADHLEREQRPLPTKPRWDAGADKQAVRAQVERVAAAFLDTLGTPTLTPVGEHPEPGARGLLPVMLVAEGDGEGIWRSARTGRFVGYSGPDGLEVILTDPRPDDAV